MREARNYCSFVEHAFEFPLDKRLESTRRRLLALYSAALLLPAGELDEEDDLPSEEQPKGWVGFGEKDFYWEIYDPYVDADRVGGLLSDDVLDVYGDVREGLAYWDADRQQRAIWAWRFLFEIHWGDHAVDALRALHRACKTNSVGDECDEQ